MERSNRYYCLPLVAACAAMLLAGPVAADPIAVADIQRADAVDFEKEILPIFRESCLACHNASDAEGDLVMETPQTILKGGSSGAVVVPGKAAESYLLKTAMHDPDASMMPPEGNNRNARNLKPEELGLIKLWINQGAKGEVTGKRGPVAWQPLPPGVNPVYAIDLTDNGRFVAAGRANQIFIYDVRTGQNVTRLTDPTLASELPDSRPGIAHLDIVQALEFHPSEYVLASGGFRNVKIWRRPDNSISKKIDNAGPAALTTAAVSADGKQMAVAGADKSIKIYGADGKEIKTLPGHGDAVTGVAFSPAGLLASVSKDKTLKVWNIAEGKPVVEFEAAAPLTAVAFVGEEVAVGAEDNKIYVYPTTKPEPAEAAEGEEPKPFEPRAIAGHGGPITSIVTVPEKAEILSSAKDNTIRWWTVADGKQVRAYNCGGPVMDVALSADTTKVAGCTENGLVQIFQQAGQRIGTDLKGDLRAAETLVVATRLRDKSQSLFNTLKNELAAAEKDVPTKQEALKKANEEQDKAQKAFDEKDAAFKKADETKKAADKELADATAAKTAAQTKVDEAKKALEADKENADKQKAVTEAEEALKKADEAVKAAEKKVADATKPFDEAEKAANEAKTALDAAQRGVKQATTDVKRAEEKLATTKTDHDAMEKKLAEDNTALEEAKKISDESQKGYTSVAFSPDGVFLAAASVDGLVHAYAAETGKDLEVYAGHTAAANDLVFTSDSTVASVSEDKSLIVWDLNPEWTLERTIGSPDDGTLLEDRVVALDFNPAGDLLATGGGEPSRNGELKIWNWANGSLVKEIPEAHSDTVFDVEFSDDGKYLASGAADKFLKVFNVESGELFKSYEGHTHHVLGLDWKFDGKVIATAGADNAMKLWNVETGDQQRTINNYAKQVTSLEWVGITDEFVSSGGDKTVRRHRASNGGQVRTYSGGTDYMYCVAVTPDGEYMAAGGQDSTVFVWNSNNGTVVRTFAPPTPPESADDQTASAGE